MNQNRGSQACKRETPFWTKTGFLGMQKGNAILDQNGVPRHANEIGKPCKRETPFCMVLAFPFCMPGGAKSMQNGVSFYAKGKRQKHAKPDLKIFDTQILGCGFVRFGDDWFPIWDWDGVMGSQTALWVPWGAGVFCRASDLV